MLPERMKKGEYLIRGNYARRIKRVRKHPEFIGEKLYILEGDYGVELDPMEVSTLNKSFDKCITPEELNELFRKGEYLPSKGKCRIRKRDK